MCVSVCVCVYVWVCVCVKECVVYKELKKAVLSGRGEGGEGEKISLLKRKYNQGFISSRNINFLKYYYINV